MLAAGEPLRADGRSALGVAADRADSGGRLDDATVVASVNEIEALTTGLSEKIWQKIDMISREE